MAAKEVIEFVCDNCGEEDVADIDVVLPEQWVTVQMTLNHEIMDPVDLCGLCRAAFAKALTERRS